jgi:tRNA (guanine37-N1)-methyltransferase
VVRLLPGFMGNPASLLEESHAEGLLEYPVYTRPVVWRGREVPQVLLSGDHAGIAAWRREQAERRTAARRPDLLPPAALGTELDLRPGGPADAGELMTLQRACWVPEQRANPALDMDTLTEDIDDVRAWTGAGTVLVLRSSGRLVGAVRGRQVGDHWYVDRLMVAPDLQGRGLGRELLRRIEESAPAGLDTVRLSTGAGSKRNLRLYRKAGYRVERTDPPGVVRLVKRRR